MDDDFYSEAFAAVFDRYFVPDLDSLAGAIRRYAEDAADTAGGRILDLCCGTGHVIAHFAANGYQCVGVDSSEPMLAVARRRNADRIEAGAVDLVQGDATGFVLDRPVDLVTCTSDSLNHLTSAEELGRCFAAVRAALRPGGLFVFDVHSVTGLRLQNFSTVRDLPDLLLTVRVTLDPFAERVVARIVGFTRPDESSPWTRFAQNALNTAWPAAQIEQLLAEAGFAKAWPARLRDLGSTVQDPDREPRLFFVARG